ncbi:hypothetical protein SAMN04487950_2685 [Halogranum rubrum]|uniref:Uncharacterized protein n=1 Tax=Halogranum rubrum TaxID=553466 RepID=A0A1I4F7U4_9EURY|nr:hypothetical protein [Halogranum rubrum]SFL13974.1 hypothetical protein SAMN04487950_2685 [Halogranum rubrum]
MGVIRTVFRFFGLAFYLAGLATGLYALTLGWSVVQSGGSSVLELVAALCMAGLFLLIGRALSQRGKGLLGYGSGAREQLDQ